MKEELEHLKLDQVELSTQRLNIAKQNKSPAWDLEDLETVLKNLKNNKAHDPLGNANDRLLILIWHVPDRSSICLILIRQQPY